MVNLLTGPKGSGKHNKWSSRQISRRKNVEVMSFLSKRLIAIPQVLHLISVQFVWMIFHLLRIPMSTLVSYMECIAPTTILSAFYRWYFKTRRYFHWKYSRIYWPSEKTLRGMRYQFLCKYQRRKSRIKGHWFGWLHSFKLNGSNNETSGQSILRWTVCFYAHFLKRMKR